MCWFYAIDNKSREETRPTHPTDPVFGELRAALTEIINNDQRMVKGLDGKLVRYMEAKMPIKAVRMLAIIRQIHGKFCSIEDVIRQAHLFAFGRMQAQLLLNMFHQLGTVLHFPDLSGCKHLVVLEVQWLIDAMACLIREEEHHGSLLKELLADDDSPEGDL